MPCGGMHGCSAASEGRERIEATVGRSEGSRRSVAAIRSQSWA